MVDRGPKQFRLFTKRIHKEITRAGARGPEQAGVRGLALKSGDLPASQGIFMSSPSAHPPETHEVDAVEAVVPLIPMVLPLVGAVLMFLLAFIAVFMA
jgi:hypothetical protein